MVASDADDAHTVQRVFLSNFRLVNSMGDAMLMIPAGMANDATNAGLVAENIAGNLGKVLTMCVRLFTENAPDRLTFKDLQLGAPGGPLNLRFMHGNALLKSECFVRCNERSAGISCRSQLLCPRVASHTRSPVPF